MVVVTIVPFICRHWSRFCFIFIDDRFTRQNRLGGVGGIFPFSAFRKYTYSLYNKRRTGLGSNQFLPHSLSLSLFSENVVNLGNELANSSSSRVRPSVRSFGFPLTRQKREPRRLLAASGKRLGKREPAWPWKRKKGRSIISRKCKIKKKSYISV